MAQEKKTGTEKQTIDILYDGYREYMFNIKGYKSCATRGEITEWERFKNTIFTAIDKKQEQGEAK